MHRPQGPARRLLQDVLPALPWTMQITLWVGAGAMQTAVYKLGRRERDKSWSTVPPLSTIGALVQGDGCFTAVFAMSLTAVFALNS